MGDASGLWTRPPLPESVIPDEAFDVGEPAKAGAIDFGEGPIEINVGRECTELVLVNTGDRPIQIGAHYHLAEANRAMAFDRMAAFGFRLDIASGTSIRFEPGQSRKCKLVRLGGMKVARGMNDITNGPTTGDLAAQQAMRKLREGGFCFEGETLEDRSSTGETTDARESKGRGKEKTR